MQIDAIHGGVILRGGDLGDRGIVPLKYLGAFIPPMF